MSIPGLQRLRCQYDGDYYLMDLARDEFVHFTPRDRAKQILASGKLLMRPPYEKFGIDAVAAISTVWGSWVPGVQTTHSVSSDLVAIRFKTQTMPEYGSTGRRSFPSQRGKRCCEPGMMMGRSTTRCRPGAAEWPLPAGWLPDTCEPPSASSWKAANVMWDRKNRVPVLVDLGDQW
jgi:hypothetical protein